MIKSSMQPFLNKHRLQISINVLLACGLFSMTAQPLYAENAESATGNPWIHDNSRMQTPQAPAPLPAPVAGPLLNGLPPITWGECVPVPFDPSFAPVYGAPMPLAPPMNAGLMMPPAPPIPFAPMNNNADFIPMPAPNNLPLPPPLVTPPPVPVYDVPPAPVAPSPVITSACDNQTNDSNDANKAELASAQQRIQELTQMLDETQNQLQDSVASLEELTKNATGATANTEAL